MPIEPPPIRLGIDLGGTKTEIVALAPDGTELLRRRTATPVNDYPATLQVISTLIQTAQHDLGDPAVSIGIGTPGSPSPKSGLMRNCNATWLNGQPLQRDLELLLTQPVRLANDANCFTLSEAVDGAGKDCDSVFGVILGTGVGGGIALAGRSVCGVNAIAGEWGHNPLPWPRDDERPGPACYCGRTGCLETFLSGPGFAADHAAHSGQKLRPDAIVTLAEQGDVQAVNSLRLYLDRLARGLATVINLLDPAIIVIGGGLSHIAPIYKSVPKLWGQYIFSDIVSTQLVPARHGDSSGVRGAAWLWSRNDNHGR